MRKQLQDDVQDDKPDKYWAAEVLSSAVRICQEAGIVVVAAEDDGLLWLGFPGMILNDDGNIRARPDPEQVTP